MANLKEIRNRINSVGSTMQITSAMKMVSAAKLRKAQDAITAMRPYANKLSDMIGSLSTTLDETTGGVYAEQRPVEKVLILAISSNRGLAGALNSNINKQVLKLTQQDYAGKEVSLYTIGKKVSDYFAKRGKVFNKNTAIFDELNYANAEVIATEVMQAFADKKFDKVVVVYNHFKNAGNQIVLTEQMLPIQFEATEAKAADYLFEPSKTEILSVLTPKAIKMQLYKALRDAFASEHGARMTAMHKATDNAKDLKAQLTLSYNKARQAAITNEILEIVSGAEALNG
ncbi:MAG: ATP synthase F1 subunit gamma [Flavobacteriaceae bacterium]|nr:ATP synthase F1 subunit gamma [Flavobacteriaceae bacterium]